MLTKKFLFSALGLWWASAMLLGWFEALVDPDYTGKEANNRSAKTYRYFRAVLGHFGC